jgi:hypothetical protein
MTTAPPDAILREVCRSGEPDVIEFVTADGHVLLMHAHEVHVEERRRTRETILRLLRERLGQG